MSKTIITPKGKVKLFIKNGKRHFAVPANFCGRDMVRLLMAIDLAAFVNSI